MGKKVLIVGGVAVGASVAARLRRLDEDAEIIMFEKGPYISYANCGLPYYLGDVITDREKLLVTKPELMRNRFKIDVRNESEVVEINSKNKTIKVNSKEKGVYEENYDYLVLSPGAKPFKPNIKGIENKRIFTLRNVPDTDKIFNFIKDGNVKKAVVVGGGYVGVEMAENLKDKGIAVTLVEAAPHILAPFDSDMVTMLEKEMEDKGVNLILNDGIKVFEDSGDDIEIETASGTKLKADMIILAIGVTPDAEFLKDSGLNFGTRGHIITDSNMRTNLEGVYAGGDAVEVTDFVNNTKAAIPLAGPANKQGRIIADNIAGINTTYKNTQGTSVIKVFDLTAAGTGNNERTLERLNIPYKVIYVHPNNHAGYYPGATQISLKLIFNDEGKILGAQAIGYDGVEKRIDVIATVLRLGGTIYDLTELELSYAPPFGSAKDVVNFAGYVAENVLTGKSDVVLPREIENRDKDKVVIIDVRTAIERENGRVEDSIHIDVNEIREKLPVLDKEKEYWVHCAVGLRAYVAERILKQHGFKAKNITGGYKSITSQRFTPRPIDIQTGGEGTNITNDETATTESSEDHVKNENNKTINLDACGLSCPGPLMKLSESIKSLNEGDIIDVKASDPGFYEDVKAWAKRTKNQLSDLSNDKGIISAKIVKGLEKIENNNDSNPNVTISEKENCTMIVFNGDLDKAIASFIIANGAAAMGKKVTMFFTFWGLNILRKHEKVSVEKNTVEKMFGFMMPKGSKKLTLSKMNMAGIGGKMIRGIMKKKNVQSLEELIEGAIANGVNIVACTMSMDVMGIKKEELIDGVNEGGVGYYLGEASESNINLFI